MHESLMEALHLRIYNLFDDLRSHTSLPAVSAVHLKSRHASVVHVTRIQVLQSTLDMHQSQKKFSVRQHTRKPARATRSPKIFPAVRACPECLAI